MSAPEIIATATTKSFQAKVTTNRPAATRPGPDRGRTTLRSVASANSRRSAPRARVPPAGSGSSCRGSRPSTGADRRCREDEAEQAVRQVHVGEEGEGRHEQRRQRDAHQRDDEEQERALAAELQARDGIGGARADAERQQHRPDRDDDAVEDGPVDAGIEEQSIMVERRPAWNELGRVGENVLRRLQRGRQAPEDRDPARTSMMARLMSAVDDAPRQPPRPPVAAFAGKVIAPLPGAGGTGSSCRRRARG